MTLGLLLRSSRAGRVFWDSSTQGDAAGQGHPLALGSIISAFQAFNMGVTSTKTRILMRSGP
jgi:hypothetical protein